MKQNKLEFNKMNIEEKILWRAAQYTEPQSLSKEEAFNALMKRIVNGKPAESRRTVKMPLRFFYAVAAAVAGLLLITGTWFIWHNKDVENVIAEKGHQTDVQLPDGSNISLNADTRISFHKTRFDINREVDLDGEAFFSVEKGNAFFINTDLADIEILGTSFNVYARDNSFRVSCFTGKIRVTAGSQSAVISPMETARVENGILTVIREDNIHASASWRNGEFIFENTPLILVFEEIERQYNVIFMLPKTNDKYFTGSITNKNLVNALDIVCLPMGLTYEIGSNSKVFVTQKPD